MLMISSSKQSVNQIEYEACAAGPSPSYLEISFVVIVILDNDIFDHYQLYLLYDVS